MKKVNHSKFLASLAFALLASVAVFAQGYKLGDKVEGFSLKNASNQEVKLSDYAKSKVVAVIFTNTQCAYSKLYENRLVNLARAYANQGVQFIFINPSIGTGDGSETLQDLAAKKYSFPYLADEGQKVSSRFGATKTPEAFVLQNNNGAFVLKYKGAIDDNAQVETDVKDYYLKKVIDEVLANKTVTVLQSRPTGCMIRRY